MGWLTREGRDGKRSAGLQVEIPTTGTLLCGRSSRAELILEETAVSRRHAIFFRESERDWVRDAGSTNGTRVNGEVVREPRALRDGDRIAVGVVELVYREDRVPGAGQVRAARPAGEPPPPLQSRRWREVTLVGRGGMGEVWRAEDRDLAAPVAIKRLRRRRGADLGLLARLHAREAALGRTIEHPNVVRVLEESVLDGDPLLLLEWVEGQDLEKRGSGLSIVERLEILRQTALGLSAAHDRDIVHADLKPANLLIQRPAPATRSALAGIFAASEDDADAELAAEIERRLGAETALPDLARLPFVGREAELGFLREVAREVEGGGLRWVLLHGERGVGRTALIEEGIRRAGGGESGASERWGVAVAAPRPEPGEDPLEALPWAPPPADGEGLWLVPLPPHLPDDPAFTAALEDARGKGIVRTLFLRPFLRGEALRLVEKACASAETARAFLDATDRAVWSSPARLREALAEALERGALRPRGATLELEPDLLRPDELSIAKELGERLRAEEKGVKDLLRRISIVAAPLGFSEIGAIAGFEPATLYYLLGHAEGAGYLRRVPDETAGRGPHLHFPNGTLRLALDRSLTGEERRAARRAALASLRERLEGAEPGAEALLAGAALAREEGRRLDAFRWSLRGALAARQRYDRESFFAAVDAARDDYRSTKEGAERRSLQECGREWLGPGGAGLTGLDRLRALPIEVAVKITDFGIARRATDEGDAASGGGAERDPLAWGTPRYMSPEQARGEALGTASDIYSLGLVARELMEGEHPLGAARGKEAAARLRRVDLRPEPAGDPLVELLRRLLDPRPGARPRASEVADELQRLQIRAVLADR